MWTKLKAVLLPRGLWGVCVVGVGAAAFCWGRSGAWSQAPSAPRQADHRTPAGAPSDYAQRAVAYVYNSVPLTREALGEFLISRFATQERLEFFINCQILEMACKAKGIYVTDAEVDAQVRQDVLALTRGTLQSVAEFEKQLLAKYNKTLLEYKEDVVRPRIAISKLVRGTMTVTEEDLRKAFEARYGPKVQCRWILFQPDDRHRFEVYAKIRDSEEAFADHAKKQFNPYLATKGGKLEPIHKHFGDPQIEKKAFSLKPGQVSELLQIEDKTWVVLKCDEHIPGNAAARFEEERTALFKEVSDFKLAQEIPRTFAKLRQQAAPRLLLANNTVRAADLEREVRREIEAPAPNQGKPILPK